MYHNVRRTVINCLLLTMLEEKQEISYDPSSELKGHQGCFSVKFVCIKFGYCML